jgi:hypothetical protein
MTTLTRLKKEVDEISLLIQVLRDERESIFTMKSQENKMATESMCNISHENLTLRIELLKVGIELYKIQSKKRRFLGIF